VELVDLRATASASIGRAIVGEGAPALVLLDVLGAGGGHVSMELMHMSGEHSFAALRRGLESGGSFSFLSSPLHHPVTFALENGFALERAAGRFEVVAFEPMARAAGAPGSWMHSKLIT